MTEGRNVVRPHVLAYGVVPKGRAYIQNCPLWAKIGDTDFDSLSALGKVKIGVSTALACGAILKSVHRPCAPTRGPLGAIRMRQGIHTSAEEQRPFSAVFVDSSIMPRCSNSLVGKGRQVRVCCVELLPYNSLSTLRIPSVLLTRAVRRRRYLAQGYELDHSSSDLERKVGFPNGKFFCGPQWVNGGICLNSSGLLEACASYQPCSRIYLD